MIFEFLNDYSALLLLLSLWKVVFEKDSLIVKMMLIGSIRLRTTGTVDSAATSSGVAMVGRLRFVKGEGQGEFHSCEEDTGQAD